MKTVKVVAAVIKEVNDNGEPIIFATQRGYGEFKDGWEFPGGKIEAGETPQEALKREIMEELDTKVKIGNLIDTIEYDYPNFHLLMDCFWCEIVSGELKLKEHENAKWLTKEHLDESLIRQSLFFQPVHFLAFHTTFLFTFFIDKIDDTCKKGYQ